MGWTVVVFPVAPRERDALFECGCCGLFLPVKRQALWLSDGEWARGRICPECVLKGPRGAAALLRARLRESRARRVRLAGRRSARDVEEWERYAAVKAAAIEAAEEFPLAARRAAVRETRERR